MPERFTQIREKKASNSKEWVMTHSIRDGKLKHRSIRDLDNKVGFDLGICVFDHKDHVILLKMRDYCDLGIRTQTSKLIKWEKQIHFVERYDNETPFKWKFQAESI